MKKTPAKKPTAAKVPTAAAPPPSPDAAEAQAKLEYLNGLVKADGASLSRSERSMFDRMKAQMTRNSQAQQQAAQAQQLLAQGQQIAQESGVQMNLLVDLLWESKQRAAASAATPDVDEA